MKNIQPELIEPCEEAESCLAEKLRALAPINDRQSDLLAALEKERRTIEPGEALFEGNAPVNDLYVLKKGWVLSETVNAQGMRSVVRVHHPGDIIGASQVPYASTPYRAIARSEAIVCPFPRQNLVSLLSNSPRLSALLLTIAMIESAEQEDRASVFRRNSAKAKLALFVQQTFGRLRLMNTLLHDRFHCPLNQTDIGDVVGMTSVHVSRTFTRLEEEGGLERHGTFIRVRDESVLSAYSGYIDRYKQLDLSWMPET
ncbi:Crp/Fnr family transcriptional regulator [Henriciella aquimarina]|uniref:Crp/Fnr family transcriptional regulator n=1 Tax=Henriciella aquimarina TaxID=545261 RepID=UPI000A0224E1|nr:Crp/Fnr family transcriptional regulator [Henriciella aquimarina]